MATSVREHRSDFLHESKEWHSKRVLHVEDRQGYVTDAGFHVLLRAHEPRKGASGDIRLDSPSGAGQPRKTTGQKQLNLVKSAIRKRKQEETPTIFKNRK